MWPQGGSTSGLNLRFLKKGELGADTKTSRSGRGRNHGPDHSANPLGESYKLLYLCHFNVYSCLIKSKLSNSPVNSLLTTMQKSHQSHGLFTFFCFVAMHFTMYRLNGQGCHYPSFVPSDVWFRLISGLVFL